MKLIEEPGSRPIRIWTDDIEDSALDQLRNIARLPIVHAHGVAAMPDVHWGLGATIGSVIATTNAIIPAAVGVDIGCGMNAVRTSLAAEDLPDSLAGVRSAIEAAVPTGPGGAHRSRHLRDSHLPRLPRGSGPWALREILAATNDDGGTRAASQLGTLGSGNHFIELCLDESGAVWIMLHSGSRGTGNKIGMRFIAQAKRRAEATGEVLPDRDLAYFPDDTPEFADYVSAVTWCQDYALENRRVMMESVLDALRHAVRRPFELTSEAVNCHHNYVERERHFGEELWVTRKGAIRARAGDRGIIPGSMGQRSYIVAGLGSADSYSSCAHGAGRRMGRKAARRTFSVEDLRAQTEGVECRKDAGVLDEIPAAYKDIDEVMANQRDLVEVLHTLKQVLCVKGA